MLISLLETNMTVAQYPGTAFGKQLEKYEAYCQDEFPRVGELRSYSGFSDWYSPPHGGLVG